MKYLLFSALILCVGNFGFTQSGTVTGNIIEPSNEPVLFANVVLRLESDSSLVKGEITNENGDFLFENIPYGSYFLTITAVGYLDTIISLDLNEPQMDLNSISLTSVNTELNEVNITATRPMFTMQPDKMVVHVEGSPISQGNTAWELLGKLPGVSIMDGRLVLRGKGGVNIMVNDKPLALSGTDLENYLKSIHATQIKNIELITNPSAKYDAQGNSGIINIVLAKPSGEGFRGSVATGYGRGRGTNKSYMTVNLSHSGKKGDLIFVVSGNYQEAFNNLDVRKNFYDADTLAAIVRNDNRLDLVNQTLAARLGYDWYISPKTSLSLQATGNIRRGTWDNSSESLIFDGNDVQNTLIDFGSFMNDRWSAYSGNAHFSHQLDSMGQKITADFDLARYMTNSNNMFQSIYRQTSGNPLDTLFETGHQIGPLSIYSAKVDYTKPFKSGLTFEAGVKSSYVKSDKDVAFFFDGDENALDSTKSNHFVYSENINAAYINFSKQFNKLSTQFGLRMEHTNAAGNQLTYDITFNRQYAQVFPTLFLNYQLKEKHALSLNSGRRINRPHYQQLNPFIRPIDALAWASGNPDLQPELLYNSELTYSFANKLFIQGSYSYTTQGIITVLAVDPITQNTLQQEDNVDTYHEYSLMLMYNAPIKKWWYMNLNFTGFFAQYDGSLLGFYFNRSLPTFHAAAQNTFVLKRGFKIEQNYMYMHRHLYGTTTIKPMHSLSLGVKKDILKGKGTIALNASDIFWTNYPRGEVEFNGVEEFWTSERDTRTVYLHFTYNFGRGKNVQVRRQSGADDEKQRAR
ncbi:MAG: TonB-dependent receptor [bacterium]|nr:TonB-dependent receptor [bacterium]